MCQEKYLIQFQFQVLDLNDPKLVQAIWKPEVGLLLIFSSTIIILKQYTLQIVQIAETKFWAKFEQDKWILLPFPNPLHRCLIILCGLKVLIKSRVNLTKIMVDIKNSSKAILYLQLSDLDVYAAWIYASISQILFPIASFGPNLAIFVGTFYFQAEFLCPLLMQRNRPQQEIKNKKHQIASNFRSISPTPSLPSFSMLPYQTCFLASNPLERFSTC